MLGHIHENLSVSRIVHNEGREGIFESQLNRASPFQVLHLDKHSNWSHRTLLESVSIPLNLSEEGAHFWRIVGQRVLVLSPHLINLLLCAIDLALHSVYRRGGAANLLLRLIEFVQNCILLLAILFQCLLAVIEHFSVAFNLFFSLAQLTTLVSISFHFEASNFSLVGFNPLDTVSNACLPIINTSLNHATLSLDVCKTVPLIIEGFILLLELFRLFDKLILGIVNLLLVFSLLLVQLLFARLMSVSHRLKFVKVLLEALQIDLLVTHKCPEQFAVKFTNLTIQILEMAGIIKLLFETIKLSFGVLDGRLLLLHHSVHDSLVFHRLLKIVHHFLQLGCL
mmetsp:Transcript_120/g.437  ORF Transcript_120/g.437 Transcript_120/m.437 type:complete len:339 (+) Transcript_120:834-1850(+)